MLEVFLLTLVTCGIYLFLIKRKRDQAKTALTPQCCSLHPSVAYLGWYKCVDAFEIGGASFALAFMRANRTRIVDLDPVARDLLGRSDYAEQEARKAATFQQPAQPTSTPQAAGQAATFQQPAQPTSAPLTAQAARKAATFQQPTQPTSAPLTAQAAVAVRGFIAADHRAQRASSRTRFLGVSESLTVAGRSIRAPLTYVSDTLDRNPDASTIVTTLPVGNPARAQPMSYWPRYAAADEHQRAVYLNWMAAGRRDPNVPIGYVFIFFYGLERRVLIDNCDEEIACAEVRRLQSIYAGNGSFQFYSSEFLAFTSIRSVTRLTQMSESELTERLGVPAMNDATALGAIAAWYHLHQRPLPAQYAASIARSMDGARRGVVVQRAAVELLDLFSLRYQASFRGGLLLEAAKSPMVVTYRPASATLSDLGASGTVSLPNVLGKPSQFHKVVELWNECVSDLKKTSARKAGAKELDADAWAALPSELRAEYDHPDQDRWDGAVGKLAVLAQFRLARAGQLATLAGLAKSEKLTAAQMKKIATRASDVGYAIEPEPRLLGKGANWDAEVLVWRTESRELPTATVYRAVLSILSLAVAVALADGRFSEEEHQVVNSFLTEAFEFELEMRTRVEAMKHLVARQPPRLGTIVKTLRQKGEQDRLKIGAVLVAIAAADGIIDDAEEKTLRTLYKGLGLPDRALAAAVARVGARLKSDATVEAQPAGKQGGVPIPPPPEAEPTFKLDQAAIAAIVADTRAVAQILADVFEHDDGEPEPSGSQAAHTPAMPSVAVDVPRPSPTTSTLAAGLDVRYHAVLEQLLARDEWDEAEVRQIAAQHKLMPGAILETINTWSDDALGDFLIEDAGAWKVRRELAKVTA